MAGYKKIILQLIGDIGIFAVALVHTIIGKYYINSIPPLSLTFLGFALMWLILGIVRLPQIITALDWLFDKDKR